MFCFKVSGDGEEGFSEGVNVNDNVINSPMILIMRTLLRESQFPRELCPVSPNSFEIPSKNGDLDKRIQELHATLYLTLHAAMFTFC